MNDLDNILTDEEKPEVSSHTEDSWENPLSNQLTREIPTNWRMEGNKLIGDTPNGQIVHFMPVDVLLVGTDKSGKPIFEKLK